jgi:ribonuclease P protein component
VVLASAQRLRRREEFAATVRAGRRSGRGGVVVHLMLPETASNRTSTDPAASPVLLTKPAPKRAGFVVPKTVGNAVARNRVRRRLRHLVRERLALLPAGSNVVVRALPAAAKLDYDELGRDLDAALRAAVKPRQRDR